ncbi:ABC transporter permease [Tissierella sp. Yu-01]|uniref:ABC transporter permease n=1 Tax=Tissierella sp. Yu-01 TaxID=3035694 RepID=UPI00240DD1D4|nr:ABC transporter permease [Tissierella sp. Yu-01]WFA08756.1 ABC transporter permease [Tissierella sp. Yu-01]
MKIRDMVFKDFRIALSDRAVIIELMLMPIILMTILGFALTISFKDYSNSESIKIAVVKEYDIEVEKKQLLDMIPIESNIDINDIDFGDFHMERIFFEDFLGNNDLKEIIQYEILTKENALEKLEDREITAIVILPNGFIRDTMINFGTSFRNVVDIEVIGRTDKNISTTIVEEIIKGFSDILNYNISAKNTFSRIYSREGVEGNISDHIKLITERISNILGTERPELEFEQLNDRPPMNSRAYYSFGMTAMFILFGAGYGSKFLLEEKRMGTYDRMSASGVKKSTIVIGKACTIFLVGLTQMLITYIFSTIVLKVQWGEFINLVIIFIASAFTVAALGTMLASITYHAGSYNIANMFTSFIVQIMSVLGGSMVPIEVMPGFARFASKLVPNGLMMNAVMKNYYGYGMEEISLSIVGLLVYGLVFFTIAIYLLLKEGRKVSHVKRVNAKADSV